MPYFAFVLPGRRDNKRWQGKNKLTGRKQVAVSTLSEASSGKPEQQKKRE